VQLTPAAAYVLVYELLFGEVRVSNWAAAVFGAAALMQC
jgi:hypothetical protein